MGRKQISSAVVLADQMTLGRMKEHTRETIRELFSTDRPDDAFARTKVTQALMRVLELERCAELQMDKQIMALCSSHVYRAINDAFKHRLVNAKRDNKRTSHLVALLHARLFYAGRVLGRAETAADARLRAGPTPQISEK